MENRTMKILSQNGSVPLKLIYGHFATNHSHINCYLDMTTLKTRQSEAELAAQAWCSITWPPPSWIPSCVWTAPRSLAPTWPRS